MTKSNFDCYLDQQLKGAAFAARFKITGQAWDMGLENARCAKMRLDLKPISPNWPKFRSNKSAGGFAHLGRRIVSMLRHVFPRICPF
jgi:hypothetical protein